MAEYIDRDVLIDNLQKFAPDCYSAAVNNAIVGMPKADVAPVVHERWEWDFLDVYRCSACGETSRVKEVMGEPVWDFCPNCGSKMDGGKNHDD